MQSPGVNEPLGSSFHLPVAASQLYFSGDGDGDGDGVGVGDGVGNGVGNGVGYGVGAAVGAAVVGSTLQKNFAEEHVVAGRQHFPIVTARRMCSILEWKSCAIDQQDSRCPSG